MIKFYSIPINRWIIADLFAALLPVIVGGLSNKIINEKNISEEEAFDKRYNVWVVYYIGE